MSERRGRAPFFPCFAHDPAALPFLPGSGHADALALVPAAGGRTARDVLVGMYRTAAEREALAGQQGATTPPPPKDLLNEFRTMLAREAQTNAQLPKNMDQLCFGLLDPL